jgi:hypothetical protein
MGSPQFNYLTDADSHWAATHAASGAPVFTADFTSLATLPNGTMDCPWFMEHDPGCAGLWVDRLVAAGQKAAVLSVVVAGSDHFVSVPYAPYAYAMADDCQLSRCGCQLEAPDHKHPGRCTELRRAADAAVDLHHASADSCGVLNGDGSSCAAAVLAEAWEHCPQACESCALNRRGCLGFSSTFMARLDLLASAGRVVGTALFAAYLKHWPYRRLLLVSQVG